MSFSTALGMRNQLWTNSSLSQPKSNPNLHGENKRRKKHYICHLELFTKHNKGWIKKNMQNLEQIWSSG